MDKVFITGIGAISSIGNNVIEQHESLKKGKNGIARAHHFKSKYTDSLFFAEIGLSDDMLRSGLGIDNPEFTRTTLIAIKAFKEAVQGAALTSDEISSSAFISSSTVGGMCYTDELYSDANMQPPASNYVKSYEASDHTLRIIETYNIKGYSDTINTACSSSANAIMLGIKLIQAGKAKRVIVGGSDCLAKYTVNGFNSLRILSEQPCKPFDENRDGLTLGEGAAYLVLEAESIVGDKTRYAEIVGYGNSNDAFHPSATSDEARGPLLAMKLALSKANISESDIDYINAHGTGTPNNDVTETFAFTQLFKSVPPYNSTKSYTGHTLAASGAIEAIYCILSMRNNELYQSLQVDQPIAEFDVSPIPSYSNNTNIDFAMSNSFGFGGNCTSLIFKKCTL